MRRRKRRSRGADRQEEETKRTKRKRRRRIVLVGQLLRDRMKKEQARELERTPPPQKKIEQIARVD